MLIHVVSFRPFFLIPDLKLYWMVQKSGDHLGCQKKPVGGKSWDWDKLDTNLNSLAGSEPSTLLPPLKMNNGVVF